MILRLIAWANLIWFALGMWIGRRLTRPATGQIVVGWREMWRFGPDAAWFRRNPKSWRVFLWSGVAFFATAGVFVLADSLGPKLIAFAAGSLVMGVGWGAALFNKITKAG